MALDAITDVCIWKEMWRGPRAELWETFPLRDSEEGEESELENKWVWPSEEEEQGNVVCGKSREPGV